MDSPTVHKLVIKKELLRKILSSVRLMISSFSPREALLMFLRVIYSPYETIKNHFIQKQRPVNYSFLNLELAHHILAFVIKV